MALCHNLYRNIRHRQYLFNFTAGRNGIEHKSGISYGNFRKKYYSFCDYANLEGSDYSSDLVSINKIANEEMASWS